MKSSSLSAYSTSSPMAKSRLVSSKHPTEDDDLASQLTEQQLHIWDHTALLYHGYEWQEAANAFALLSKDIHCPQLRSFCLANTAMILARLGEYGIAASFLAVAAQIDSSSFVVVFLMGIVAYELQDYSKARYCFEICLEGMRYEAINYSHVGLHFVLDRETLHHNIQEASRVQFRGGTAPDPIHAIPAEVIFEAPPSRSIDLDLDIKSPERAPTSKKPARVGKPASAQSSSFTRDDGLSLSPRSVNWLQHLELLSIPQPFSHSGRSKKTDDHHSSNRALDLITKDQDKITLSPGRDSKSHKPGRQTWRDRPKTPFTPRDARGVSDSTRELARFIKKGSQVKHMTPRDPRGEYESVEELSNFVQAYAPDVRNETPLPFDLDPDIVIATRLGRILDEQYDRERRSELKKDSAISNSPILQPLEDPPYSPVENFTPGPAAAVEAEILEILQPAVYEPPKKPPDIRQLGSRNGLQSEARQKTHGNGLKSPTSDSSSEKHKKRQRDLTLQVLEGKCDLKSVRNLTFPLRGKRSPSDYGGRHGRSSWKFGIPSPVGTEHFFEKVLGQKRHT